MYTSMQLNHSEPYALDEELDWIRGHASTLPDQATVVILGGNSGVLALALYEGNPGVSLTVVDPGDQGWCEVNLGAAGYSVVCVAKGFVEYGLEWNKLIDFLVIDTITDPPAVLEVMHVWFPHLRAGGTLLFHDYKERPGGFTGQGAWQKSAAGAALDQLEADHLWQDAQPMGISLVCRK